MTGPSDTAEIRRNNLALVLAAIDAQESCSRTTIRSATGLVSGSVSSLVDDLVTKGLVIESEAAASGPGRPRRPLRVNPSRVVSVIVQLSRLDVIGEIRDFDGRILWQQREVPAIRQGRADDLVATLANMLSEASDVAARLPDAWCTAPVIAMPSPVVGGRTAVVVLQFGLGRLELADALAERLPGEPDPVIMNVGRLAAYGEYAAMPVGQRPQSMAYLATGTESIMGGLVIDGSTYLGSHMMAGESGHISVAMDGPWCRCGVRGCLEFYLGLPGLLSNAGLGAYTERHALLDAVGEFAARLDANDAQATAAIEQAGAALASAIGTMSNWTDVELIIIGGTIARFEQWLLPKVREMLDMRSVNGPESIPQIALARFGEEAPRVGAWRLARQTVLDDPAQVPVMPPAGSAPDLTV